jgi:chromosome partitioning protein
MAITVSLINMKGGVGKTTLAAQLAHAADLRNLKVLAVDLDPQSNLSHSLLGPVSYVQLLKENKPTVSDLFENYFPPSLSTGSASPIDINKVIIKKAGYWQDTTLDLIPSRLELSHTLKNPTGKERKLAKKLSEISDQYDLILLDCAPTESILTDAAYHASRYVLIPVKPEFMATIGLPLLTRSINGFKYENADHALDICGVVFNHSSTYSEGPEGRTSIREVQSEAIKNNWYVYKTHIRYSASYAKSARETAPIKQTSYVRSKVTDEFSAFVEEFFTSIGL